MKRIAIKLLVFLLLGAVVNVAVAWGVANLLSERHVVTQTISGEGIPTVTTEHLWPVEDLQGWPTRCFSETVPLDDYYYYSAVVTVIEFKNVKLAHGPIWSGLAINTLFYTVVIWLLWSTPFAVRQCIHWHRVRHGKCVKCGYDLRGAEHDVCPECGAT